MTELFKDILVVGSEDLADLWGIRRRAKQLGGHVWGNQAFRLDARSQAGNFCLSVDWP